MKYRKICALAIGLTSAAMLVPAPVMAMSEDAYLVQEMTGEDVAELQTALMEQGYLNDVDGYFGPYTEAAVRQFQQDNGLYADGEAGPVTLDALQLRVNQPSTQTPSAGSSISDPDSSVNPESAEDPGSSAGADDSGILENIDLNNSYLKVGSRGELVESVQEILKNLGYLNDGADGIYGTVTAAAVRSFQETRGLAADGEAGPITLAALFDLSSQYSTAETVQLAQNTVQTLNNSIQLSTGSTGSDVVGLQEALNSLGYSVGSADGYFGPVTANAVSAYQRDNGLYVDGVAGPATLSSMNESLRNTEDSTSTSDFSSSVESYYVERLASQKLAELGNNLYSAFEYCAMCTYSSLYADTPVSTAVYNLLTNDAGNCMNKAAAFQEMATQLGYECRLVSGIVMLSDNARAEHAWTEITIDSNTYVCDPNFEWDTAQAGDKKNGYMFHYGDAGTWVYQILEYLN